jgi:hypothetical protein
LYCLSNYICTVILVLLIPTIYYENMKIKSIHPDKTHTSTNSCTTYFSLLSCLIFAQLPNLFDRATRKKIPVVVWDQVVLEDSRGANTSIILLFSVFWGALEYVCSISGSHSPNLQHMYKRLIHRFFL